MTKRGRLWIEIPAGKNCPEEEWLTSQMYRNCWAAFRGRIEMVFIPRNESIVHQTDQQCCFAPYGVCIITYAIRCSFFSDIMNWSQYLPKFKKVQLREPDHKDLFSLVLIGLVWLCSWLNPIIWSKSHISITQDIWATNGPIRFMAQPMSGPAHGLWATSADIIFAVAVIKFSTWRIVIELPWW